MTAGVRSYSKKQLLALAATRIEELLQDLSQAMNGADSYDFGTQNLVNDLRQAAEK